MKGELHRATFVNKDTGVPFDSLVFIDESKPKEEQLTLVGFSSNLGELSDAEIIGSKNQLQVVQLVSGTYKLCKVGESSWHKIDLGL